MQVPFTVSDPCVNEQLSPGCELAQAASASGGGRGGAAGAHASGAPGGAMQVPEMESEPCVNEHAAPAERFAQAASASGGGGPPGGGWPLESPFCAARLLDVLEYVLDPPQASNASAVIHPSHLRMCSSAWRACDATRGVGPVGRRTGQGCSRRQTPGEPRAERRHVPVRCRRSVAEEAAADAEAVRTSVGAGHVSRVARIARSRLHLRACTGAVPGTRTRPRRPHAEALGFLVVAGQTRRGAHAVIHRQGRRAGATHPLPQRTSACGGPICADGRGRALTRIS